MTITCDQVRPSSVLTSSMSVCSFTLSSPSSSWFCCCSFFSSSLFVASWLSSLATSSDSVWSPAPGPNSSLSSYNHNTHRHVIRMHGFHYNSHFILTGMQLKVYEVQTSFFEMCHYHSSLVLKQNLSLFDTSVKQ